MKTSCPASESDAARLNLSFAAGEARAGLEQKDDVAWIAAHHEPLDANATPSATSLPPQAEAGLASDIRHAAAVTTAAPNCFATMTELPRLCIRLRSRREWSQANPMQPPDALESLGNRAVSVKPRPQDLLAPIHAGTVSPHGCRIPFLRPPRMRKQRRASARRCELRTSRCRSSDKDELRGWRRVGLADQEADPRLRTICTTDFGTH